MVTKVFCLQIKQKLANLRHNLHPSHFCLECIIRSFANNVINEESLNIYGNIRNFSADHGLTTEENVPNVNRKRFFVFLNQFLLAY